MGGLEWAMLSLLAVLWGGSYFFTKIALHDVPPMTIVFARAFIGGAALLVVLRLMGQRLPRAPGIWRALIVMGALNNFVPVVLMVWGQRYIAIGLASILNATTPLFTVFLAQFLTHDEKLTLSKLVGIVLGFLGVATMIGTEAMAGLDAGVGGEVLCLLAALLYGFSAIYGRRFPSMGLPPITLATGQVTASAAMILPLTMLIDRPWLLPPPGLATWASLLCLGLLSTTLGFILFFRILATAGATNLMLVTFLSPVTAILLGAGFLGERLAPRHILGVALIAIGLAALDGRPVLALRRWTDTA
jgi:drug/metabolite transporter (DMT)-like permease